MHNEPLAFRMRPRNIDEIAGQKDIIGEKTALYRMIKNGHVPSMLLYGEPGIGKTSLAHAIAGTSNLPFIAMNATFQEKKMSKTLLQSHGSQGKYYYSLMKFIVSINYSKIPYCHMLKVERLF